LRAADVKLKPKLFTKPFSSGLVKAFRTASTEIFESYFFSRSVITIYFSALYKNRVLTKRG
jgi:hypothetical protein